MCYAYSHRRLHIKFLEGKALKKIVYLAFIAFAAMFAFSTSNSYILAEEVDNGELNELRLLHDKLLDLDLVTTNDNGLVVIKESVKELEIEDNLLNEYKSSFESANKLVNDGYGSFDENLIFSAASEETIKYISKNSGKNELNENISLFAIPEVNLTSLVERNRREVDNYYMDMLEAFRFNPNGAVSAYVATVNWWVGKVDHGGPWDYKRTSMGPYNKQWHAYMYGYYRTVTTEYIGNYNFGYTGEALFSLQILYYGGQYANGNILEQENYSDRAAINTGFSHAVSNW